MSNTKKIAANTIVLYVRMIFVLLISLYTSRIVLQSLGVVDFGIYNVVGGFVSMFSFLNATLSSSMQRFYNFEGTVDKEFGYHRVYSTGLIIHIVLCIAIFILLESVGLWYINNIMVLPEDRLIAANVVYQASVVSMIFVILQIPYMGVIMAVEKMSFYAYISMGDAILKLVLVLLLPYVSYDKLSFYAIIVAVITFLNFLFYFVYAKKVILKKRFKWEIDKKLFKSMMSFSGWNLLGTFAFLLKGQGLNMILNLFFGPIVNAARGIAYQVNSAVNNLSSNISIAFRPQIVNSYAEKDFSRVTRLMFLESKSNFILMLMVMIPISLRIDYILRIWLGSDVPLQTNIFTILLLVDALVCSLNTPISQVAMSVGEIKYFQIASSIVNILLIPASWFALYMGYAAESVFTLTIIFSIINQIVCVLQLKKMFNFSLKEYLIDICIRLLTCGLVTIVCVYLLSKVLQNNFIGLILLCIASIVLCCVITYIIGLNKTEKEYFRSKAYQLIHKLKKIK